MRYLYAVMSAMIVFAANTVHAQSALGLSTIGINVTNASGNARDWVGLFPHGAANTGYVDWTYVACDAKTCPTKTIPKSTVTVHLTVPSTLGQADIRLLSLDASNNFQVVTEIDPDLSLH